MPLMLHQLQGAEHQLHDEEGGYMGCKDAISGPRDVLQRQLRTFWLVRLFI